MVCDLELITFDAYMAGAVLDPLNVTKSTVDERTRQDERYRLSTHHVPTGGRRKLRKITLINKLNVNERVLQYYREAHLQAIMSCPGVDVNLSCPGLLDVNEYTARLPKKKRRSNYSFEDVTRKSVAESVLQTSQTIFNQLNVFSHPWVWGLRNERCSPAPMVAKEPYLWSRWDDRGRAVQPKLVVFVFSTAILDKFDMTNFTCTDTFRDAQPFDSDGKPAWDVSQMLWAMIYDFCAFNRIQHFVLTTYDKWIFGLFNENFRSGFVRPAMNYDAKGPTVLQTLVYWLDAAWRAPAPSPSPRIRDDHESVALFHPYAVDTAAMREPVLCATPRQENFNTIEFPSREEKEPTTYKGAYGQETIESFD